MRLPLITMSVIGVMLASTPVVAQQNNNSVQARLDRVEREMQTLSRSVFKGDVPPPQMGGSMNTQQAAQVEVRMNQIEESLRRLTGMVEENSYRIRQLTEASSNNAGTVNSAPSAYQNDSGSANSVDTTTQNNQPTSLTDNGQSLGTLNSNATTAVALYDDAFSYLQRNDFAAAQTKFQDFINQYPNDDLAANAKYWLGETYYGQNNYQEASRAFARAFKDHPDGQKAPDTLLKLAMSLNGQNMTQEACLTLAELNKRFPDASSAVKSQVTQEQQAYGCN